MELITGGILISSVMVHAMWKVMNRLYKGFKYRQISEIIKGVLAFGLPTLFVGIAYEIAYVLYITFKPS
ncbi:hypothetical protein SY83_01775 [Paenibacillus swuensis]|uniref:Uncharacterized protein n=1 Tax=Paenibacillus swuensis TaxID=1178515 RepID=A0A172TEE7_9BACL|nr:hypothetical protein [Paenibacillus swuensis]ANE45267.1 hypothetical protein SY83_01775 [Paenibacillus swuensis]